jgi:hypothetical protein
MKLRKKNDKIERKKGVELKKKRRRKRRSITLIPLDPVSYLAQFKIKPYESYFKKTQST